MPSALYGPCIFRENEPLRNPEQESRSVFEAARWPEGPVCPFCGAQEVSLAHSSGTRRCRKCRGKFTVTVGTIFSDSHIPLATWRQAIDLVCDSGSEKVTIVELQRRLKVGSFRSAKFVERRLRWAMEQSPILKAADPAQRLALLLQVKPTETTPRPGTNRGRSVWAEVEAEMNDNK